MFLGIILTTLLAAPLEAGPDCLVVASQECRDALQPWVRYRESQGHRLQFAEPGSADEIRAAIRAAAGSGTLRSVVLVGDAMPHRGQRFSVVPTHFAKATINVQWGSEPEIATDNWYADLDDDQLPDLAVGRMTADTPAELAAMTRKVMEYETSLGRGTWRRRLNFIAGVGGFGPLIDPIIEKATQKFLTEGVPAEYSISMTYGSWRSPYFPDPRRFRETAVNRFNEGCLFWVYLGHGQRTFLDQVRVPGGLYPILDTDDVPKLDASRRHPIAIFLSCYAGAYDEPRDCIAEEMLRSPSGPVAVVAGSRVTMPYAMGVMGNELLKQFFEQRRQTVGELLLHAKRQMALPPAAGTADLNRQLLDAIAKALSPAADRLKDERLEHLQLFNLLGDPLLRLPHAEQIAVSSPTHVHAGNLLTLQLDCPLAGEAVIELVCRRDRTRVKAPRRFRYDPSDQGLKGYMATYQEANDRCWIRKAFQCALGSQSIDLEVPDDARGPCHVRVYVEGEELVALGACDTFVRRPEGVESPELRVERQGLTDEG